MKHPDDHPSDSDEPRDPDDSGEDRNSDDDDQPVHGQVRHSNLSARLPESVGTGVFSNGVMILTGPHEVVLDFALRIGEPHRIVSRVVMTPGVAHQFVAALQENLENYSRRFEPIHMPRARTESETSDEDSESEREPKPPEAATGGSPAVAIAENEARRKHPENRPGPSTPPDIEDIYRELRLSDEMLSGRYANAVLIRHSPTEFCFDFITNIFPRSAVSSRIYMAAPHVPPFLNSLTSSLSFRPPDYEP